MKAPKRRGPGLAKAVPRPKREPPSSSARPAKDAAKVAAEAQVPAASAAAS